MTSQLQNRLVGTLVLAAIGVIFLPNILDGEKVSHKDTFIKMPERPKTSPVFERPSVDSEAILAKLPQAPVSDEQPMDDQASLEIAQQPSAENAESVATEANSSPAEVIEEKAVDDKRDGAWVIQLGSFRHGKNVQKLLKKLRSEGFITFTRPIKTSSGELTKVFVGPDLSREKLEASLPKLKRLTNLNGKVTSFMMDN